MVLQAVSSQQEYAELQQQLQEQTERHDREVSDLTRMTSKVQDLEFDLGNMRQSLQVFPFIAGLTITVVVIHMCHCKPILDVCGVDQHWRRCSNFCMALPKQEVYIPAEMLCP